MDSMIEFGLEATRWLQQTYPQLAGFFDIISYLGDEEFYLLLFPLVYWCFDKRVGRDLAYLFVISFTINSFFKHLLRGPRPFWLDESLGGRQSENYGSPSGHTQLTVTIYLFACYWLRKKWVYWLASITIVLMMISRVYVGAHFVHDVVLGFILGSLIILGYFAWLKWGIVYLQNRILGQRLLAILSVPVVFVTIYLLALWIMGEPDNTVAWAQFNELAEKEGVEGMATAVGTLLGTGIGIIFEPSRVRFQVTGTVGQRIGRYILGIVVAFGLWVGLGQVFPDDPQWLAIPLRILRYTLVTAWISYYAPAVFVYLNLAKARPEPESQLTIQ